MTYKTQIISCYGVKWFPTVGYWVGWQSSDFRTTRSNDGVRCQTSPFRRLLPNGTHIARFLTYIFLTKHQASWDQCHDFQLFTPTYILCLLWNSYSFYHWFPGAVMSATSLGHYSLERNFKGLQGRTRPDRGQDVRPLNLSSGQIWFQGDRPLRMGCVTCFSNVCTLSLRSWKAYPINSRQLPDRSEVVCHRIFFEEWRGTSKITEDYTRFFFDIRQTGIVPRIRFIISMLRRCSSVSPLRVRDVE